MSKIRAKLVISKEEMQGGLLTPCQISSKGSSSIDKKSVQSDERLTTLLN